MADRLPSAAIMMRIVFIGYSMTDKQQVVTSLLAEKYDNKTTAGGDKGNVRVILSEHNAEDSSSENSKRVVPNVLKIITHQNFGINVDNDIALLRLDAEGVSFGYETNIRPACTPDGRCDGYDSVVTGRGVSDTNSNNVSSTLQELHLPIISKFKCVEGIKNETYFTDTETCTGYPGSPKSPCFGDSGGPLQIVTDDNHYHIVGVTSFKLTYNCTENYPTIYTRVSKYLNWIAKNTIDACQCPTKRK